MSEPAAAPTTTPDPKRWRALAVCFAGGFITMLDVSIVNVALPSMREYLNAGPTQLQFIIAGYALAFGLFLVPAGRLGDVRGRRTLFMIAVAGFGLTSLAAGFCQTDTQLAIFRLLQGGFAGMSNPQVSGIIQQLFTGRERARAFGFFGAVIGVSTALGPLIGGLIIGLIGPEHGWRWVFFINVPICLVVVPLAKRLLPDPPLHTRAARLDAFGLLLIGATIVTFMAPFVFTPSSGFWDDPERWWLLAPLVVLLPGTYIWERRYQHRYQAAVLNPTLLRTPSYVFGALLGAAYFAGNAAIMLVVSMFLQDGLGFSALATGLVQLPFAVASGVAAAQSGRLVSRWGRKLVLVGLAIVCVTLLIMTTVIRIAPIGAVVWVLTIALFFMGTGNGSVISPNQSLSFQDVPPRIGSVAGALLQVGQRSGAAIGTAIVMAVYLSLEASSAAELGTAEASVQAASWALTISAVFVFAALFIGVLDARRRTGTSPASLNG